MKRLITAALAVLALAAVVTTPTLAQTAISPTPVSAKKHHEGQLKKMASALNLTADQKAQIKPIRQSAHQQIKTLKADASLTPEAQKAQIKAIHKSTRQQTLAILTPAQRAQWKAMKHQHRKNKI